MSTDPRRRLQLGALVLAQGRPGQWHDAGPYRIRTMATNADFGNPQPMDVEVPSDLEDGSLVETTSHGNRSQYFMVQVIGPNAEALAQGEVGLMAELERPNTLAWTPPAGFGETTVFDVRVSHLEWSFDDYLELRDGDRLPCRTFGIRLTSGPFGRSVEEVVIEGIGSGAGETAPEPTVTTIYSGVGTTGWSGEPAPMSAASGGGVQTATAPNHSFLALTRAGTLSLVGTPWIRAWIDFTGGTSTGAVPALLRLGGESQYREPLVVDGNYLYWRLDSVAAVSQLQFVGAGTKGTRMVVRSVSRQDRPPTVGATGRQVSQTIVVPGTARTPARFVVEHATLTLGSTLIYTRPDDMSGYQPPLRRHRHLASTTAVTTDAATYSGARSAMTTGQVDQFEIPAGQVPAGSYGMWARVRIPSAGSLTMTVTASTVIGGVERGQTAISRTITTLVPGQWTIVPLGELTLPPTRVVAGSAATVRILVGGTAGDFDDMWAFHESGALSWIECGTDTPSSGGSSNRLRLDSPTAESHRAVWVGHQPDWSDARHADQQTQVLSLDHHQWRPGLVQAFCATAAPNAKLRAALYPHWMHNAARITPQGG